MTPERWDRISELYAAAVLRAPDARAGFLALHCGDDLDLRHEVESLLAQQLESTPVVAAIAPVIASGERGTASGARLGAYRLGSLLGEGGMGEVYRAHDETLARDVAIKILPPAFATDAGRRARFEREARVLASLNHPNIGAIYGVVEGDGHRGLVLELVEGETLAERLQRVTPRGDHTTGLPMTEIIAIARQVVEALDAAHERGIVHRDLKPANVKISPDGLVKVLDFGLAKAVAIDEASFGSGSAAAPTSHTTGDGVVVGTIGYMSPEQARGRPVDKRTDIWAFGCMLYEMLTGRLPFAADMASDIVIAIVEHEPDWAALPADTPAGLARLVRRCLEKNVKQRLRDIGDAFSTLDEEAIGDARPGVAIQIAPRLSARVAWSVAALLATVIAAGGLWLASQADDAPPTFTRAIRVTSGSGLNFGPAISPDGKWIAYFSNERGPTDIWVKFLTGGNATNLTADRGLELPTRIDIGGLAISPDGTQIAFDAGSLPGTPSNLFDAWVIAAPLGGVPTKLVERGRGLRWAHDGKHIAYVRAGASAGDSLYVADADGTNERQVVPTRGGMHVHWPAWSANGRFIYFSYSPTTSNSEPAEIYRVPAAGGPIEPVVTTPRRAVFPAPTSDGRGLLYAANPVTAEIGLWWKPLISNAAPRPVTTALGEFMDLTLSHRSGDAVASIAEMRQSIVAVAIGAESDGNVRAVTNEFAGDLDPTMSPRGDRLVFSSLRSGNRNLWFADANGANPRPLTTGSSFDERPSLSPDGRRIAFVSDRGGQRGIWVMNVDGGAPRLLVHAPVLDSLSWSPDGRELVYATPVEEAPGLWVADTETGIVQRLQTPGPAISPMWNPTSDLIAYVEAQRPMEGRPNSSRVSFVSRRASALRPKLSDSPNVFNGFLAWSPDGRQLAAFVDPGATSGTIWVLDPSGAAGPQRVAILPPGVRMRGGTWASDGRAVLVGCIRRTSDIVLFQR